MVRNVIPSVDLCSSLAGGAYSSKAACPQDQVQAAAGAVGPCPGLSFIPGHSLTLECKQLVVCLLTA